jgi:hypothetical protein
MDANNNLYSDDDDMSFVYLRADHPITHLTYAIRDRCQKESTQSINQTRSEVAEKPTGKACEKVKRKRRVVSGRQEG